MPAWFDLVLELLKITLPALVVFLTADRLLGRHLGALERTQLRHHQAQHRAETLPQRLQAYERLSLFCERIAIPSLLLRLRDGKQSAGELKLSLLLAIQHEYEHNIAQQVYLSQQLWDIIRQARDNTMQAIESVSDIVEPDLPAHQLARALLAEAAPSSNHALALALAAIKKEAALLFE